MKASDKKEVFSVNCPICHAVLWVDHLTKEVIKSEKGKRKKDSLEELLLKEKKRIDEFGRKFEATAELEKEKMDRVKKKFEKVLIETKEVIESEKEERKEDSSEGLLLKEKKRREEFGRRFGAKPKIEKKKAEKDT